MVRGAGANLAREHPVPDNPLSVVHLPPGSENGIPAGFFPFVPQRQELLLYHVPQPERARSRCRQQQSDRLGQIAHGLAGFVEEPVRNSRRHGGPFFQLCRCDEALHLFADQKKERPGRVVGRHFREVAFQRIDLACSLRRLVEGEIKFGKPLHVFITLRKAGRKDRLDFSSSDLVPRASILLVFRSVIRCKPGLQRLRVDPFSPEHANDRADVAVGDVDLFGPRCRNRLHQAGPVGVVR